MTSVNRSRSIYGGEFEMRVKWNFSLPFIRLCDLKRGNEWLDNRDKLWELSRLLTFIESGRGRHTKKMKRENIEERRLGLLAGSS